MKTCVWIKSRKPAFIKWSVRYLFTSKKQYLPTDCRITKNSFEIGFLSKVDSKKLKCRMKDVIKNIHCSGEITIFELKHVKKFKIKRRRKNEQTKLEAHEKTR